MATPVVAANARAAGKLNKTRGRSRDQSKDALSASAFVRRPYYLPGEDEGGAWILVVCESNYTPVDLANEKGVQAFAERGVDNPALD